MWVFFADSQAGQIGLGQNCSPVRVFYVHSHPCGFVLSSTHSGLASWIPSACFSSETGHLKDASTLLRAGASLPLLTVWLLFESAFYLHPSAWSGMLNLTKDHRLHRPRSDIPGRSILGFLRGPLMLCLTHFLCTQTTHFC